MLVITVARKPMEGTVAKNVLAWGTGGINIDACRIAMSTKDAETIANMGGFGKSSYKREVGVSLNLSVKPMDCIDAQPHTGGRWPANLILSQVAAVGLDEQSGVSRSPQTYTRQAAGQNAGVYSAGVGQKAGVESLNYGDTGGASRFFKVVKP